MDQSQQSRESYEKAFHVSIKNRLGTGYGKGTVFARLIKNPPHPKADWLMYKWQEIMVIPPSIIAKNDYLLGGVLLDNTDDYLKSKGVKLPE